MVEQIQIMAKIHTDDHLFEASFDATEYFQQATDEQIEELASQCWSGEAGKEVARFIASRVLPSPPRSLRRLFIYLKLRPRRHGKLVDFVCQVDNMAADKWLEANRPTLHTNLAADSMRKYLGDHFLSQEFWIAVLADNVPRSFLTEKEVQICLEDAGEDSVSGPWSSSLTLPYTRLEREVLLHLLSNLIVAQEVETLKIGELPKWLVTPERLRKLKDKLQADTVTIDRAKVSIVVTDGVAEYESEGLVDVTLTDFDDCTICEECEARIPAVDGGSLQNRHHEPSCSLYDETVM